VGIHYNCRSIRLKAFRDPESSLQQVYTITGHDCFAGHAALQMARTLLYYTKNGMI